jgi:hypothetical protein
MKKRLIESSRAFHGSLVERCRKLRGGVMLSGRETDIVQSTTEPEKLRSPEHTSTAVGDRVLSLDDTLRTRYCPSGTTPPVIAYGWGTRANGLNQ